MMTGGILIGFLIGWLPELPVAMDGRTNLYSDAELRAHVRTWSGQAPPGDRDPRLEAAKLVLASKDVPLTAALRADPRFEAVYEDALSVVLRRR